MPNSFSKNAAIFAEQLNLVKAENEIKSLIDKINVQLNELLVEELQLKSNQITTDFMVPEIFTEEKKPTNAEIIASYDSQLVNQQLLDLSTLVCSKSHLEEEDDDE